MKFYLLSEPIKTNKLEESVYNDIKQDYELTNGSESTYAQRVEFFQI